MKSHIDTRTLDAQSLLLSPQHDSYNNEHIHTSSNRKTGYGTIFAGIRFRSARCSILRYRELIVPTGFLLLQRITGPHAYLSDTNAMHWRSRPPKVLFWLNIPRTVRDGQRMVPTLLRSKSQPQKMRAALREEVPTVDQVPDPKRP